jgi:hypothetical protein
MVISLVPGFVVDGGVDSGLVATQRDGEQLVFHGRLFLAWSHRLLYSLVE